MLSFLRRLWNGTSELDQLRAEVESLKAAAAPNLLASGVGGFHSSSDLGRSRSQLEHNRGWVYACVKTVATRCAGQAVSVGRRVRRRSGARTKDTVPDWVKQAGGEVEPLSSHPVLSALADPNEVLTAWHLVYLTVAGLQLTGRAYWWLDEASDGRLVIWPLPSSWVRPLDEDRHFASYEVRPRGSLEGFTVQGEDMIRFSLPDPADPLGSLSPLAAAARAVFADVAIEEAQRNAFKLGLWPGMGIRLAKNVGVNGAEGSRPELSDAQREQLRAVFRQRHQGVEHFGETIILDAMIEDVFPLTRTPHELAFLESSKLTKERITQIYGVNPISMGQVESANKASSYVADEHFVTNTVNPLLRLLGETATGWLRFRYSDPALVLWCEPARARDEEAERARFATAVKAGVVRKDEVRSFAGLAPLGPEAGGDELVAPQPAAAEAGAEKRSKRRSTILLPGRNGDYPK